MWGANGKAGKTLYLYVRELECFRHNSVPRVDPSFRRLGLFHLLGDQRGLIPDIVHIKLQYKVLLCPQTDCCGKQKLIENKGVG